jgi:hypothetical protein
MHGNGQGTSDGTMQLPAAGLLGDNRAMHAAASRSKSARIRRRLGRHLAAVRFDDLEWNQITKNHVERIPSRHSVISWPSLLLDGAVAPMWLIATWIVCGSSLAAPSANANEGGNGRLPLGSLRCC